jgi:hypothetical protein
MCILVVLLTYVYHDARFRECRKKKYHMVQYLTDSSNFTQYSLSIRMVTTATCCAASPHSANFDRTYIIAHRLQQSQLHSDASIVLYVYVESGVIVHRCVAIGCLSVYLSVLLHTLRGYCPS